MSLGNLTSKIKGGAKDLTSFGGMKNMAINLGLGAAIGAAVALIVHALQLFVINKYAAAYAKIDGYRIYPNSPINAIFVEDIILILATVGLLFTKKLWLTVGFFLGWYGSNYLGLYTALALPVPATTPTV